MAKIKYYAQNSSRFLLSLIGIFILILGVLAGVIITKDTSKSLDTRSQAQTISCGNPPADCSHYLQRGCATTGVDYTEPCGNCGGYFKETKTTNCTNSADNNKYCLYGTEGNCGGGGGGGGTQCEEVCFDNCSVDCRLGTQGGFCGTVWRDGHEYLKYECRTCRTICTTPTPPPPTATPPPPPPPVNLSGACTSQGQAGPYATVSWTTVPNTTFYALRINDLADGWSGTCTSAYRSDVCTDVTGSSYSFTSISGHTYSWWLHACNSAGCSPGVIGPQFTCNIIPTITPSRTPTKPPVTLTPTKTPTKSPTKSPTKTPTRYPTKSPTKTPTKPPTKSPTKTPTKAPTSP